MRVSAQLHVIKYFLRRNQRAEEELKQEIDDLFEQGRQGSEATKGLDPLHEDEWLLRMEETYYLDAVHSTAAVGLLAPFLEALYVAIFQNFRSEVERAVQAFPEHDRSRAPESKLCDPNYFFKQNPKPKRSIVRGTIQLAELIELEQFFPSDYRNTLDALFSYRNKMLHCGFVWPEKERENFKQKFGNSWPEDWFECMDRGDESYVIYVSPEFINHCLRTIDDIMTGVEKYYWSLHQDELKMLENIPKINFFNLIRNGEIK